MKVLLINPICYDSIDNFVNDARRIKINSDEPLGLMYISSYVKQQLPKIEIEVFDWHIECLKYLHKEKILTKEICLSILECKIRQFNPYICGVSGLYEYNKQIFHETLEIIKYINGYIMTIVGGIYPTTNDVSFNNNIDYILKGEGEIKFCALLKEFGNLELEYNELENDMYISEIDKLPLPDRSTIPVGYYGIYGRQVIQRVYKDDCKTASIMISRGCPNNCTYCSGHVITKKHYRCRSVENIVNEIRMLKDKYDIEVFIFREENHTVNKKFCKKLYKALIPLYIKWYSDGGWYVNNMDREIVELSIKSGLLFYNLAMESGSKRIQRITKKSEKIIEMAPKVINWIREFSNNIYIICFFMFGFPFETWDDINDSIELAKNLDADWSQINQLQLFKGCELYDEYTKETDSNDKDYINSNVKESIIDNKEKSDYIYEKMNIDLNFKNNRCIRIGNYDQVRRDMQHILNITNGTHKYAKKIMDEISEYGKKIND